MGYPIQTSTTHLEQFMTKNVGGIDRILRIAVGAVLVALAATGTVGLWGWIGAVPLATGLLGWCPPYQLLGWNTCSLRNHRGHLSATRHRPQQSRPAGPPRRPPAHTPAHGGCGGCPRCRNTRPAHRRWSRSSPG